MILRIGVSDTVKELEVDVGADADADAIKASIASDLGSGDGMLWLTDKDGRQVGVPAAKVAYVDIGAPVSSPKIGFGA